MAAILSHIFSEHVPGLPTVADIFKQPSLEERKKRLRARITELSLVDFDPGVFDNELLRQGIVTRLDQQNLEKKARRGKGNISSGTYDGTQAAVTHAYKKIERSFESYFDVLQIEPTIPRFIDLEFKKTIYQYSSFPYDEKGNLAYPPHLQCVPLANDVPKLCIFNAMGLIETGVMVQQVVPDNFINKSEDFLFGKLDALIGGCPQAGPTIADCERYNRFHRKTGTDIERGTNIGLLPDWYSDRRFADQAFTGTNPTTIEKVPADLLAEFIDAAERNGYTYWAKTLSDLNPASLFVQDCRYFRKACGVEPGETMHWKEPISQDNWACAAVTLFQLFGDGKLHPVAIVCDYKQNMASSVTIFNRRHRPSDPSIFEKEDWPWRYAKTCAQVTDWIRHEVGVHLTRAHFIEESVIVATHRTIPMEHIVYKLLQPHWYKTLSLNAAARQTLVPQVIKDLIGLSPDQTFKFMAYEFESFDYVQNYVPNDLARRGFPNTKEGLEDRKYKNYAYAKNILSMWHVIRDYVMGMLLTVYEEGRADEMVREDVFIQDWCKEARNEGRITGFPTIQTLDELCDAVTMCIHIASPFHTTVNYLQNFYQAFVIAKPPMLCQNLPQTLEELLGYTEADMTRALPIGRQREWLLAAQVPWLLSFKVASDSSLIHFAHSQWRTHCRLDRESRKIQKISEAFYYGLRDLEVEFLVTSRSMDKGSIPYTVMDPVNTAVSILI
ncbi:lipoxygenase 1 [Colletotrichum truncatum]|uniref:Lipoxygenase 1 n=1 Tax=Colletotrichum truncatum TaxID=5467 RepID=A0ACC3YPA8_COLTU|nr:lipoxygenase 1 [Colletotrichum truncatum]KAF6784224.1 lipoxygenase 1 [Colletotrichum truncatum]